LSKAIQWLGQPAVVEVILKDCFRAI